MARSRPADLTIQPDLLFMISTGEVGVLLAVVPRIDIVAHDGVDLALWGHLLEGVVSTQRFISL